MKNIVPENLNAWLNKDVLKGHLTYLNIIGVIIFIFGLLMLYYVYFSSFYFILGYSGFDESWSIRLAYLMIIALVGGFVIKQAITLLGDSRVLTTIILILGITFLLFAFWTAQVFVELVYQANPFTVIGIVFFIIMIAIGMFFFVKAMADLIQMRKKGLPQKIKSPSEQASLPQTENTQNAIPLDPRPAGYKICPKCLSQVSPDDTHCTVCGKKQD